MKNEFCTYEHALALKDLGFDEPCFGYWRLDKKDNKFKLIQSHCSDNFYDFYDLCLAPLYQQAFRWFREKHNLRGFIGFRPNSKQFDCHIYDMSLSGEEYIKQRTMEEFNKDPKVGTYEEAENACLDKLIEIAQQLAL